MTFCRRFTCKTAVIGVVLHEGGVTELQVEKPRLFRKGFGQASGRAGQFCFLNVPELSCYEWHPFSLTSGLILPYDPVSVLSGLTAFGLHFLASLACLKVEKTISGRSFIACACMKPEASTQSSANSSIQCSWPVRCRDATLSNRSSWLLVQSGTVSFRQ